MLHKVYRYKKKQPVWMSVCLDECPVRVEKRYMSASPFTIYTII